MLSGVMSPTRTAGAGDLDAVRVLPHEPRPGHVEVTVAECVEQASRSAVSGYVRYSKW